MEGVPFHFLWLLILFTLGVPAALVAVLIVWAVQRRQVPASQPQSGRETPLDILDRRFASGEISAEEYQKARDLLERKGG